MTVLRQLADFLPNHPGRVFASRMSLGGISPDKGSFVMILVAGYGIAAVLFSCRGAFITSMLNDTFVFLDGAYRMSLGQIPHRDFSSLLSLLTFAIFEVGLRATGDAAQAISIGMAICVFCFSPIVAYLLASRLHIAIALPFSAYLVLLIAAPMHTGGDPSQITVAMIYNRLCWAAVTLIVLLFMEPKRQRIMYLDATILGVLLISCMYLKITYFIVALTLTILWSLLRRSFVSVSVPAVIGSFSVIALMEFALHINAAYFRDIQFFVQIIGPIRSVGMLIYDQMLNVGSTVAVAGVASLLALRRNLTLREGLLGVAVVVGSFALLNQSAQKQELPPLMALMAIGAEKARRASALSSQPLRKADASVFYLLWLLLLVSLAQPTCNTAVALAKYVSQSLFVEPRADLPAPFRHLVVADLPLQRLKRDYLTGPLRLDDYDQARLYAPPEGPNPLYQSEYLDTVVAGARSIEPLVGDRSVIVFDFVNPISVLLGLPCSPGLPITNMAAFTFNTQMHIPPERLFAAHPLVAVPKRAVAPITRDALIEIYRPYLQSHYRIALETPTWTIVLPR